MVFICPTSSFILYSNFNEPQHVQQTSSKIAPTEPMLASYDPANSLGGFDRFGNPNYGSKVLVGFIMGYHFNDE